MYKHFRKFLIVQAEDGMELYFRFYDPRVLRIFLPTCTRNQLIEFFGPVQKHIMEDEDPSYALIFSLENGILRKERVKLTTDEEPKLESKKVEQNKTVINNDNTIV